MIREIAGIEETQTLAQRWSHLLTILVAIAMILYGFNTRNNVLNAVSTFSNPEAGIRVNYPQNWLIDKEGNYVFRVRDTTKVGFSTTIQVTTRPVGRNTAERNVRDQLIIERTNVLIGYQSFTSRPILLADESSAVQTEFAFVDAEINPFTESVQTPVRGIDVITMRGGQAIIITFMADAHTFDEDIAVFEQFLSSLELF